MYAKIIERLEAGEKVELNPKGSSMVPKIQSGQKIVLSPAKDAEVGDIVLSKVKGKYFIHLVTAVDREKSRWQISNNHGWVNGWTHEVFGKVTEIG